MPNVQKARVKYEVTAVSGKVLLSSINIFCACHIVTTKFNISEIVVVVFSFIKQLSNATDTEVTWTIKYKFQINMLKQEQSV